MMIHQAIQSRLDFRRRSSLKALLLRKKLRKLLIQLGIMLSDVEMPRLVWHV